MKRLWVAALLALVTVPSHAQVDVEHRRTLMLQTSFPVIDGHEQISGFGYFWFNENNYPWTNTALRVIFAGVFVDAELSCFLPASPTTAIGVGGGGGFYLDSVVPYRQGNRLSDQQFFGDTADFRVFVNRELTQVPVGDLGSIPLNVRAIYTVVGSFYREDSDTTNFTLPTDFLTQSLSAEVRFGGVEPGLFTRRGAEIYVVAESNYRSGFEAFGPNGGLFPVHDDYQRLFGDVALKLPVGKTTFYIRVGGGLGHDIDELSAYKLGGNLLSVESFATTLHGYYTREIFAKDFVVVNLQCSFPIIEKHNLAGHLYGDFADVNQIDGATRAWHTFTGVGAGVSFRGPWQTDVLISYGYGFDAIRNGDRGAHEAGFALEKNF